MNYLARSMGIEIYFGFVSSSPNCMFSKKRFAYHITREGESSIADLNYNAILDELNASLRNNPEASKKNGIPKRLRAGYAPEYRMRPLKREDFIDLISQDNQKKEKRYA